MAKKPTAAQVRAAAKAAAEAEAEAATATATETDAAPGEAVTPAPEVEAAAEAAPAPEAAPEPAPENAKVVTGFTVICHAGQGRRRGGIAWAPGETSVSMGDMTDDVLTALKADPLFTVREG